MGDKTRKPEASPMLRSAAELRGYQLLSKDGSIGKVSDIYFDDSDWSIRYFVVNTGSWLQERLVLISPDSCGHPAWSSSTIPVSLTKVQVENSPAANLAEPISKRYQVNLHQHYGWSLPWANEVVHLDSGPLGDNNLRSMNEVEGYSIGATDGTLGKIQEFIVEECNWQMRYMVIDTGDWLPGRKVLVSPAWVSEINWPERQVDVDLTEEAVENSPNFNPEEPINRHYEGKLYDYYGRPAYW